MLRSVLLPVGLSACLLSGHALAGGRHQPTDVDGEIIVANSGATSAAGSTTAANTGTTSGGTLSVGAPSYAGAASVFAVSNNYTGGATLSSGTLNLSAGSVSFAGGSYNGQPVTFNGTTYTIVGGTAYPVAVTPAAVPYSQIVVFGDSLSDTGNFAAATDDQVGLRYPSNDFDYADGRFTDDTGTSPAAKKYAGVWHEQLAKLFLGMTPAKASLDGGTDYAYGDAETLDGQRAVDVTTGVTVHIDNLNRQVTNYLDAHPVADPDALYIVWAGANDLFVDHSLVNADAAADRETLVIQRLAEAGAKTFILPNLPPLGLTPDYSGDAQQSAEYTAAATEFGNKYAADLDALETTLANEGLTVKFYRLDIFDLFTRLTATGGAAYGFANITDSSKGEGVKADQYLFWDGVHPTTYGHFQIAAEAYTLLTGTPIIEVSQADKHINRNTGERGSFLLTRTGTDLSTELTIPYTLLGNAVEGQDYVALKGQKKMKAGKQTVKIGLIPTTGTDSVKVKLEITAGAGYVLPVVKAGVINIDPDNE